MMSVSWCLHRKVCPLRGCYVWLLWCLMLSRGPICCVEDWNTEQWDRTVTFISQHMLITFWSLSHKATRAGTGETTNWRIPTSEPQVGFYNINWKLLRNSAQLLAQAFSQLHPFSIFFYLSPECCDSDRCTSWYCLGIGYFRWQLSKILSVFCCCAHSMFIWIRTSAKCCIIINALSCLDGDVTAYQ